MKLFPSLFCFNCSPFCFHQQLLATKLSLLFPLLVWPRPDPSDRAQTRETGSLRNKADSKRQILTLILSAVGSEARKKRRKGKIYSTASPLSVSFWSFFSSNRFISSSFWNILRAFVVYIWCVKISLNYEALSFESTLHLFSCLIIIASHSLQLLFPSFVWSLLNFACVSFPSFTLWCSLTLPPLTTSTC